MKKLYLFKILAIVCFNVNAQKPIVYQQMGPKLNPKKIEGVVTEFYITQRKGLQYFWFKIGSDTLIHVWPKDLDTARMKVGNKTTFISIKRLHSNLWRKEKSDLIILPKEN